MNAHASLLSYLDSTCGELHVKKYTPTRWCLSLHKGNFRKAIAFGSSYEETCYKLLKVLNP